jgi:hypothetical protein
MPFGPTNSHGLASGQRRIFVVIGKSAWKAVGLAWMLAGGVMAATPAQATKILPVQQAQAEQNGLANRQKASEEAKPPKKPDCVSSDSGFKDGKPPTFVIELRNVCEKRVRCTVDAYVVGARGPLQGRARLILPPGSKDQATRKAYVMKVKSAGGMANVSYSCKAI